jgi:FkbH-like protein
MNPDPVRCLLISDFTCTGLVPFLTATTDVPAMRCTVAPFDQVVRTLIDGDAQCWASSPDLAIVWTRPEAAVKAFGRLLDNDNVSVDAILSEVDEFVDQLCTAAKRVRTLLVPTWTIPSYDRGLGLLNLNPESGPKYALLRMNARLMEGLARAGNAYVLDADRWSAMAGASATNPKLWHLGKIAFGVDVFRQAATDIKAGIRALTGQTQKLIALDLDDTLWGGIVGDLGWENITLGGHDPVGEAFVAFQRALKALTRRGIVLAIVSKNTEAVALEVLDRHPEMILRRNDFIAWRINWQDKAQNLVELANEVNLGLESVVFIDDNPTERARIREALTQVVVPEWSADKLLYERALKELTCFDAAVISAEDRARTAMYVSDRRRTDFSRLAQSLDDHLASLGLHVTAERLSPSNLPRAAQLLNKTNQMNLTTRRLAEPELQAWAETEGHHVLAFRVADRFGDYGLTGLASVSLSGSTATVDDFVLSCRVLGRGVEECILHCLTERARELGADRVVATCRPTPRNTPCREFFQLRSGFRSEGDDDRFVWRAETRYPVPGHIELHASGIYHDAGRGVTPGFP